VCGVETAELIEVPFGSRFVCPKEPRDGAYWRHLANTIEWSM